MSDDMKFVGTSKKAIWDRMKLLENQLDSAGTAIPTTVEVAKTEQVKTAVIAATAVDVASLNKFAEEITAAKENYNNLIIAIDAKTEELKDIHGIEVAANTLVAIVGTHDKIVSDKTTEASQIIADARLQAAQIIKDAEDNASKITADINAKALAASRDQNRLREEFKYTFAREKQAEEDTLQDLLDARTKRIDEREELVKEREEAADEKDTEISTLSSTIEELTATMSTKVKEAEGKAKGMAESSAKRDAEVTQKEHASDMTIKDARIKTLEDRENDLLKQVESAQKQVSSANDKISEMAVKALGAQADVKTVAAINTASGSGKRS